MRKKKMRILFAGAEIMPFAATGGLGDVLGALPPALASRGADVRAVMPLYSAVGREWRDRMKKLAEFTVRLSWRNQYCGLYSLKRKGVTWYFIDNEYYYARERLYGEYDDGERFAFFSAAVIELMKQTGFYPDVLHLHDWQAALAAVYLDREKKNGGFLGTKCVFTIHNIEYQGHFDPFLLGDLFGLGEEEGRILTWNGALNLMKGGIAAADRISTVSPTYSRQILTPEFGKGLDPILRDSSFKLRGILNGIDTELYDPEKDPAIAVRYSAEDPSGKRACSAALRAEAGLPDRDCPLFAIVSRLASHKGLDLAVSAIRGILNDTDGQLVVLGKGETALEDFFRSLEREMPDRVRAMIVYDRELSRRIYAGADILLMPSRSEPCGLAQMIACRYGTVPVVRETGGLADSIRQWRQLPEGGYEGNGFTFRDPDPAELYYAAKGASDLWYRPKERALLIESMMTTDFSWDRSAEEYLALYREAAGS